MLKYLRIVLHNANLRTAPVSPAWLARSYLSTCLA